MNNASPSPIVMTAVAVALFTAALVGAPAPARAAAIAGIPAVARAVRAHHPDVPVLLPTAIPDDVLGGGPIHTSVVSADARSYDVAFFQGSRCANAACRFGLMRAMPAPRNRPGGRLVTLPGGGSGYYRFASCETLCGQSTLTWTQNGTRYVLGLRGAGANALRFMAASVRRF